MNPITSERLRELLKYDGTEGAFRWVARRGGLGAGSVAGTPDGRGYLQIKVDGRKYLAHRLAWLYTHGRWPEADVDHINGLRQDNRIGNLREATRAQNMQNLRRSAGVDFDGRRHKWRARIGVGYKKLHIGYYPTFDEARAAYDDAKARLHPFSAKAGSP